MICPGKHTAEWKALVKVIGTNRAYQAWVNNNMEIPSILSPIVAKLANTLPKGISPQQIFLLDSIEDKLLGKMNVIVDNDMLANGQVRYDDNGSPTVALNLNQLQSDTIAHEFSHIFIDSLGGTNDFLLDKLFKESSNKNTFYTEDDKRELLADLLGKEISDINSTNIIVNLLNRVLEKLKTIFGLDIPTIRSLARMALKQDYTETVLKNESGKIRNQYPTGAQALVVESNKWNVPILDTTTMKQADYYENSTTKERRNRLTDSNSGITTISLPSGLTKKSSDPILAKAEELYKDIAEGMSRDNGEKHNRNSPTGKAGEPILETKKEYISRRESDRNEAMNKGTVRHLLSQMAMNVEVRNKEVYEQLKQQLVDFVNAKSFDLRNELWIINDSEYTDVNSMLEYNTLIQSKRVFSKVLKVYGIALTDIKGVHDATRDFTPLHEITFENSTLGMAGTADIVFYDPTSNRHIIADIKTGRGFSKQSKNSVFDMASNWVLRNADNSLYPITYNSSNMAKLQIMWLMVMAKASNPDMKFDMGLVLDMSSQSSALTVDLNAKVNVKQFLKLIENSLNDKKFLDELSKRTGKAITTESIKEMLKTSPNLFNPTHYSGKSTVHDSKDINEFIDAIMPKGTVDTLQTTAYVENLLFLKLEAATRFVKHAEENDQYKIWEKDIKQKYYEAKDDVIKYTKMLATVRAGSIASIDTLEGNIEEALSVYETYFKSLSDIKHPLIKVLSDLYNEKILNANRNFTNINKTFNDLGEKVHNEWAKQYGKINNRVVQNYSYTGDAKTNVFAFATKIDNSGKGTVRERLLIVYDPKTAIGKLKLGNPTYENVDGYIVHRDDVDLFRNTVQTKTQRDFLAVANELSSKYFVDTKDSVAYMNEKVGSIVVNGKIKEVNRLQQYNHISADNKSGYAHYHEHYEGWFPKVWQEDSEYATKLGMASKMSPYLGTQLAGYASKFFDRFTWVSMLTDYVIRTFESAGISDSELPIKYLGSPHLESSRNYSNNLSRAFSMFTKSMEFKKELDPIYTYSRGVGSVLETYKHNGEEYFKLEKKYLDNMMPYLLTGLTVEQRNRTQLFKGGSIEFEGKKYNIDIMQVLNNVRRWSSATMMFGKVPNAVGNFAHALQVTVRESVKNAIQANKTVAKWINEGDEYLDFNTLDIKFGVKEYAKLIKDILADKHHNNKLLLLAKDTLYLSHQETLRLTKEELISRNKYLDQGLGYAMFSEGDDAISYIMLAAQLHRSKNSKTGKSMYESYTTKDNTLVWEGGVRHATVSEFGKIRTYNKVEGLTSLEVKKLKFIHETMNGGYRPSEKVYANAFFYGQLLLNMKQFLPRMLKNMFETTKMRDEAGKWRKVLNDKGEQMMVSETGSSTPIPVYEWQARMVEGRMRTLIRSLATIAMHPLTAESYSKVFGSQATSAAKNNLIDAAIHVVFLSGAALSYLLMFNDTPDNDKLKKWYLNYMIKNPNQMYYLTDFTNTMSTLLTPVAVKNLMNAASESLALISNLLGVTFDFAIPGEQTIYTQRGEIAHLQSVLKMFPMYSGGKTIFDFITNSEAIGYDIGLKR